MILGMYRPFMARRGFLAAGVHARIRKTTTDVGKLTTFSLAASLLPSFAYASPLGDQPGGTVALRATFAPVLASYYKGQGSENTPNGWKGWPGAYHLEVGGHADLQLERTLGIGLNGAWNKVWQKSEILPSYEQLERPITGDLTLGAAYWLRRWSF
ncbi:MAG: hypothetical protein EAZ89_14195 [Bacteroidetes bacterium]|nr:MAG: hypothetical protein EAZ89_14195 [Bacteroidota bacterium]